jgi:hypothetical protein
MPVDQTDKNVEMSNLKTEMAPLVPQALSNDVRTNHKEFAVDF